VKKMKSGLAAAFAVIAFFAWLGGVILFFGGGLLLVWLKLQPFGTFNDWIFFSFGVGAVLGGLLGFVIYRIFREKN
jgi:hypothetical protein